MGLYRLVAASKELTGSGVLGGSAAVIGGAGGDGLQ